MNKFIKEWKQLIKDMGWTEILDACFGALFYVFIIFVPATLIFAQIISMFYHRLNFWIIIIMVSVIGLGLLQNIWWKKSLALKKSSLEVDLNYLIKIHLLIWSIFVIITGLLFIYVFIPNLQI
jgi:hypothetical protein